MEGKERRGERNCWYERGDGEGKEETKNIRKEKEKLKTKEGKTKRDDN